MAISPAIRPTPTTETGPLGSRSPGAERRLATPVILCGMCRSTPAVCADLLPDEAGHDRDRLLHDRGRGADETPRKPGVDDHGLAVGVHQRACRRADLLHGVADRADL